MADKFELRWPYGFRFEWAVKRVFQNPTGPFDPSDEASIRLRPACPSLVEILRNIPDHVGDQLQSTLVSLSQFQEPLAHLQVSHETKGIVLQRLLGDMAGNDREAVLSASSWWRQKALEHGVGYIDAVIAHYLYLGMTTDISAQWESSRQRSNLKLEIDERQKRRLSLLATAGDHISKASLTEARTSALESYLGRAEVIRDLIIYTNEKICATTDATVGKQDTDVDSLITLLLTEDKTEAWQSEQLDKSKRVASIVQLSDLCEQNNWSLVICHVETDDSCGKPKLFRRLLSVVSKLDDDFTRSKAIVRPAIQPFPMFTLSEFKASDGGRTGLTWERCYPEQLEFAETFYPHIQDLKELLNKYGRHGKDDIRAPASLSKALRRKVQLFDYFDDQDERIINPFSHFRRSVNELVELLSVNGCPSLADDQQMPVDYDEIDIAEAEVGVAEAATDTLPETPKKLIIHPYQETPLHTPPRSQMDDESSEEPSTPSRAHLAFAADSELEARIEILRSDLAVLLHAILTARDIDMLAGREAIAARLLMSKSFNEITVDRLLANPTFLERYGPEDGSIDKALPRSANAVKGLVVSLEDDTAVLVEALLAARGIEMSDSVSGAVEGLTSELVPENVAKRALENSRVKAKRRRKRRAEHNAALEVKKEIKLEREREAQVTGE